MGKFGTENETKEMMATYSINTSVRDDLIDTNFGMQLTTRRRRRKAFYSETLQNQSLDLELGIDNTPRNQCCFDKWTLKLELVADNFCLDNNCTLVIFHVDFSTPNDSRLCP